MLLSTKNQSLQIDLAGAVSANELMWVVRYTDRMVGSGQETPGVARGTTAGATDTTMLAAPANKWGADLVREIESVSVYNCDTASATVTVQMLDNATKATMFKAALAVGDTLSWTKSQGWRVHSSAGVEKMGTISPPGQVLCKSCTFSAAQVKAMNATPLVMLDYSAMLAAGQISANDTFIFLGVVLQIYGGTTDYDQDADIVVKYQEAGGGTAISATLDDFINDGTANSGVFLPPLTGNCDITSGKAEAAQDIVLTSTASPYNAAGDRLLAATVLYAIHSRAA